jgi:hypothetical protein
MFVLLFFNTLLSLRFRLTLSLCSIAFTQSFVCLALYKPTIVHSATTHILQIQGLWDVGRSLNSYRGFESTRIL